MDKKKILIPAAALQLLKDLNIRLLAETVELQKQVRLLNSGDSGRGAVYGIKRDGRPAAICVADLQMEEAYLDAEKSAEEEKTTAPVKKAAAVETSELQKGNAACTVVPLLPDLISGKASGGIGREVEEAVDRNWMESTADLELEEEGERRERLLFSAMEERFRKLEEEGERRETRLVKLEEEGKRRDSLLCSAMEEVVLLKNCVQEEKNSVAAVDLAAGKKKRGWIKWIPAAILVAVVGAAVFAKSL